MVEKNKNLKIIAGVLISILVILGGFFIYKTLTNIDEPNKKEKKEEQQVSTITPLLYKVTKEGSNNIIYLFGSIHAANAKDLVFPKYILDAYKNSHYLACEADIVNKMADAQKYLLENLIYKDGTTIKDHLTESTYNKLVDFLTKKNSYINAYEYYKPYFFISLISNLLANESSLSGESGIDNYFIKKAGEDRKVILEVESLQFQIDLFLNFSDSIYDISISESIDDFDKDIQELNDLYKYWKDGNAEKLVELSDEDIDIKDSYTNEQKKLIEDYNKKLISDRNVTMTDKVIEYFDNNQDVFFMVGTFHIVGDDGLVNKLQEKGYTVTQVK